ncbi:MAG: hypothetical protein ACR2MS_01035 [Weeksellaceae bacterium]
MNKPLQFLLTVALIFVYECIPFLYKESYSFNDIDWTAIIAIPLGIFIWTYFSEKQKNKNK